MSHRIYIHIRDCGVCKHLRVEMVLLRLCNEAQCAVPEVVPQMLTAY